MAWHMHSTEKVLSYLLQNESCLENVFDFHIMQPYEYLPVGECSALWDEREQVMWYSGVAIRLM